MPIFSRSKATDKKPSPPPTPSEDAPSPSSSPKPRASYVPRHAARDCLAAAPPGWNISSREHAMMENRKRIAMSRSQSANSLPRMRPMTRSGSDTSMGSSSLSSIASSSRVISLSDSRMAEHASRPQMHKNYFSHSGVVGRSPPVSNLAAWSPSSTPELREEEEEMEEEYESDVRHAPQIIISRDDGTTDDFNDKRPDSGVGEMPPLPDKANETIHRQRQRWQKRGSRTSSG